jgi:SAM-dependent methyltransferase
MEDPVERHPTRAEQLDILVTLVAELAGPEAWLLDLGCGKGYVAGLLLERHPTLRLVGVDLSEAALAEARRNLSDHGARVELLAGDLGAVESIEVPERPYRFVISALTFHDLAEAAKRQVIEAVAGWLAPGGFLLLYDRVRLVEASLFPLQQAIWGRLERVHGKAMRTAASHRAYLDDLGDANRPAALEDYFAWFRAAGLAPACLHLHGNVALIGGARLS